MWPDYSVPQQESCWGILRREMLTLLFYFNFDFIILPNLKNVENIFHLQC